MSSFAFRASWGRGPYFILLLYCTNDNHSEFGKSTKLFNGKIKKNTNKYSYFNVGDESVPNHTLFRGIKFDIYDVSSITINTNNQIEPSNSLITNNTGNNNNNSINSNSNNNNTNNGLIQSSTFATTNFNNS